MLFCLLKIEDWVCNKYCFIFVFLLVIGFYDVDFGMCCFVLRFEFEVK